MTPGDTTSTRKRKSMYELALSNKKQRNSFEAECNKLDDEVQSMRMHYLNNILGIKELSIVRDAEEDRQMYKINML